ncbi:Swt1 family HEPN domain-containing protein [Gryllotalpicola daejeonensis]|uniref:Swt1 family HEPN domain-containing protein n=1 Tax=Gryllotalpicola daejeonensis TaxID=993087 RepID=A0ABP7ZL80_9MICO
MAVRSNLDRVGDALDVVSAALEPFIARVLGPHLPAGVSDWTALLAAKDGIDGKAYSPSDPQVQLRVLTERMGGLGFPFSDYLSRAEQNLAGELRSNRDAWAHRLPFSADDAYRALDTAERLMRAINASSAADTLRRSKLDLQRTTYAEETRRDTRAAQMPGLAAADLTPWREVLQPHPDIASNNFARAEFAADLHQVATGGEASADYNDPVEFFHRTFLTDGLKTLLKLAARRVTGDRNADPIINLQTTFGGGKTHSMLAVWHLFSGLPLTAFPQGVQDALDEAIAPDALGRPMRRVAIVGTELSPGQSWVKPDGTEIRTIWGELAWQLGGGEGFAMVADADRTSTSPGSALTELLQKYAPAVILIDEWVAYARGLAGRDDLVGGSFESQFTFAQDLAQAVTRTQGAVLLVSVPASDVRRDDGERDASELELGGSRGREALQRLLHVIGRQAHNWTPASSTESFEIVKRRLFREPDAEAARKIALTARRFMEFYRSSSGELPPETRDDDYERRIRVAYPIHPELFDRLYADWSTLERFQRTRGVLRLMSAVVHALYAAGDDSPLIMPGSLPLDAPAVRDEISSYIEDTWKSIIESDIDGSTAVSFYIDKEKPLFGNRALTRRIARAGFLGSAATLHTAHRGIERKRVFLGVAMPGDTLGNFGTALQLLSERSSYLYNESDRLWFDIKPSLNRKAAERASLFSVDAVHAEIVSRLKRELRSTPDFPEVVVAPIDTADLAESDRARLVLLHPRNTYDGKSAETPARVFVHDLATKRGNAPRVNANTFVAVAPDQARVAELEQTVRSYLAWSGIRDDKNALDLTQSQVKEAGEKVEAFNTTIAQRLRETWIWALYPEQNDGAQPLRIAQRKVDGATGAITQFVGERLRKLDLVYPRSSPATVGLALQNHLRAKWNEGRISVGELWEYHQRYPYLARLRDKAVLTDAIESVMHDVSWHSTGFALAESYNASTGDFTGLRIPFEDSLGAITDATLLVKPEIALAQREREKQSTVVDPQPGPAPDPSPGPAPTPDPPTVVTVPNARYKGVFDVLVSGDLRSQLTDVVDELLQHLKSADPNTLEIRITVDAEKREGFSDDIVRIVRENGTNLGFTSSRFTEL